MKAITVLMIAGLWSMCARAQTAAAWNFTGNSAAANTTGANITATSVTMGPAITGGAVFNGTDYYGQDGWPATTTINPNAYMTFTVTPASGYYLTLNTIVLSLRHSTLGGGTGTGPTSWVLSSSVDGYASVLGSGTLTLSYQTFTITLPAGFPGTMSAVTFRLYGYNEIMTASGSNRFVTDGITIKGNAVAGTLATQSIDLSAIANAQAVDLAWQNQGFADGTNLLLQRSSDGIHFSNLMSVTGTSAVDNTVTPGRWYYRIEAQSPDGSSFFSPIVTVMISGSSAGASIIKGVAAQGSSVRTFVHLSDAGSYWLNIRTIDGQPVYSTVINGLNTDITTDIAFGAHAHGVYVLTIAGNGINTSREFFY